jgi:hypothetical protein
MEKKKAKDNRFGVVAVKGGFITPEQLTDALTIQVLEELEDDKRRLIGEILLEKGYITTDQIEEVLDFLSMLGD